MSSKWYSVFDTETVAKKVHNFLQKMLDISRAEKMEREAFTEKKALIDTRKQEILSAIDEMEAKLLVEDEEQRQYQDAFEIKKYIHLEKYDKAVMAALILKAEVVDENRLNVVWKHQDIYEKIFSIL